MPKPTFANLPASKRQAIIDLAVAEFAERPYAIASLSRIVERAGIAKGSIYQYFEHKQDLYLFIIEYATQQQLQLLGAYVPAEAELGFFELLRWQMQASVRVGLAAPLLTKLIYRAVTDDLPFRDQVTQRLEDAGGQHLQALLHQGVIQGAINPSIDIELAAFVLQQLIGNLHELVLRRVGTTLAAAADDVSKLTGTEVERLYDQIIQILQFGLGNHYQSPIDSGAST